MSLRNRSLTPLALLASACGAEVHATPPSPEDETHWSASPACASHGDPLTNLNALAVLECEGVLPQQTRFLMARSDPWGASLSDTGSSHAWLFLVVAGSQHRMITLLETPNGLTVSRDPPGEFDGDDPCSNTTGIQPLDSGLIVPDAVARLPGDAPMEYAFFDQESDCFTFFTSGEAHVATLFHAPDAVSYVYYDGAGAFLTLCGPCERGTPRHECANCEPQDLE